MHRLERAFRLTAIAGLLVGAAAGFAQWSDAWPELSLMAVARGAMIGWAAGVVLSLPLAWLWRTGSGRERPTAKRWVRLLGFAASLLALAPAALWVAAAPPGGSGRKALLGGRRAGDRRPNLILISIDALRRDHVSVYGTQTGLTPNLDAFAKEATRYNAAYATCPWTLPSFASAFTSWAPCELGLKTSAIESQQWLEQFAVWPREPPMLAERLQKAGYATAAEITNPFLHAGRGTSQGFESFRNENVAARIKAGCAGADVVTKSTLAWLRLNRRAPFFLWVHYIDPHSPYEAPTTPPEWRKQYPPQWATKREYWQATIELEDKATQRRYQEFCRSMYAEEVRYADAWLGKLLSRMRADGLYENSVIVITADHGEELFDHGGFEHGHCMYSEVLSVPLLVKWPQDTQADAHITRTVCLTDLTPTFLELAGVRDRQGVRGHPLPRRNGGPGEEVYAEAVLYGEEQTALITDRYQVIYHPFADSEAEAWEVYDLRQDPRQQTNLAATNAAAELRARLKQLSDQAQVLARKWEKAEAAKRQGYTPTEEDKRMLRALGYLGGR
jgi:arylsulfatase A-like enzyme